MTDLYSVGLGVGTQNSKGEWLEVYYPAPLLNPSQAVATALGSVLDLNEGEGGIALDSTTLEKLAEALTAQGESTQADIARQLA
ncbi:MAG TPA: 2,3,4,5-tetrahydropyridine-2,6-dicarboxylate N-succinyltransferase, partial [Porticoccaceae bacterium]|nr:2,3,4,5-tetrahydropyridine-2,6-dicarboxylate N-succinyltransferase [Porticoccaceae bacterium]